MKTTTVPIYLGVDIAKSHLDFALPGRRERLANEPAALAAFFQEKLPAGAHLVCEASGGYEQTLLAAAWAARVPISQVPPHHLRAYARSQGQRAKTDQIDAALCAQFGRERHPAPTPPPAPALTRLRELLHAREHLLGLIQAERNYAEHAPAEPALGALASARGHLLQTQLSDVEKHLRAHLRAQPELSAKAERVRQMSGIGEVSAWTICAELPELGTLAPGKAGALCGLAPYARDSGGRHGERHIAGGRARVRRVLHMAALTASQHNPVLAPAYAALRANGKPVQVALTAIARRMIETLNRLLAEPTLQLRTN